MAQVAQYDVVIVGSGVAGLVGAVAAARAGMSLIVLEKTEFIGGAGSWAFGATWIPGSDQAIAAGVLEDFELAAVYANYIGGGENEPIRTRTLLEQAPASLRLLESMGVSMRLIPGMGDILAEKAPGAVKEGRIHEPLPLSGTQLGDWRRRLRTPPGDTWRLPISELLKAAPSQIPGALTAAIAADQLAQGVALIARLLCAARDLGIEIRTESRVVRLMTREGRVNGVTLQDGTEIIARKAVLLTTGAYLSDSALVNQLDALPDYRSMMPEGSHGDGFKLAAEIGAAIGTTRNNLAINLGYDDPSNLSGPMSSASILELPRAHVIMVNAAGKRFGNEGTFQEYAAALREYDAKTRKLRNLPCWMIFDSTYVQQWGFAGGAPGKVPSWVASAPSIASLAEAVGIDSSGLSATVARFNTFAISGVDEDYGRTPAWDRRDTAVNDGSNPSLGAIAQSPFHAVRLRPTLQVGGSGIKTDAAGFVLGWSGNRIPGLYAVGDVTLHDEFGTGYQAGISLASCITFGCVAIGHIQEPESAVHEDAI